MSDVSFKVERGETLAILGRNGVGKTTLLSTIVGRARWRSGAILHDGTPIERMPTYARARRGIGFVPQEREIFRSLSVQENLAIAFQPRAASDAQWSMEKIYELFPRLHERQTNSGNQLSGGEQQMLSIGRALIGNPSLMLMDEPMEGLAPVIVDQLVEALHKIRKQSAMTIVLIEQHVELALEFASHIIVMDRGQIVYRNEAATSADRTIIENLIGVGA
ncbi:ABC transporter ATP-binding protein [Pseudorhodoplanes sp.]|uniref:ABC transporter ATP-binding protein n=1 Tax=Pseudorhodoplanes sp. TaxID=1934341 RepID=UPI003D0C2741